MQTRFAAPSVGAGELERAPGRGFHGDHGVEDREKSGATLMPDQFQSHRAVLLRIETLRAPIPVPVAGKESTGCFHESEVGATAPNGSRQGIGRPKRGPPRHGSGKAPRDEPMAGVR